jgi:hypothetical protein
MLPQNSIQRFGVCGRDYAACEGGAGKRPVGRPRNPVGEPDAVNPPVRFDEREVETGTESYSGTGRRKGR